MASFLKHQVKLALLSSVSLFIGILCSCKANRIETSEEESLGGLAQKSIYERSNVGLNEEFIPGDEESRFNKYAGVFREIHEKQQMIYERSIAGDVGPGFHYRGMHAKGHGCVKGSFEVTTSDSRFKFGVLKEQKRYPVIARFSNGSGEIKNDSERDLRGLAVKIFIGSMPQVNGHVEKGVHDLLMTNAPRHHARDIDHLMEFIEADSAGGAKKIQFQLTNVDLVKTLLAQTQHRVESLLSESYWSRAPYRLGPMQAVKYSVSPCESVDPLAEEGAPDAQRLQIDLEKQFQKGENVCFGFFVQPQLDPKKEPIEIYNREWKSPTYEVAKIIFPAQKLDQTKECENLQFNPWNAHADQKPLGNFNRARKHIYAVAQKFRSEAPRKK